MFVHAYLETAIDIVGQYNGEEPLASYLKKYFAQHKKFGSRDRRQISHLCYCYYRMGHAVPQVPVPEKMLAGIFLCSDTAQPVLARLRPEWNEAIDRPLYHKIALLQQDRPFEAQQIFPFAAHLSPEINPEDFALSMLVQPDTFLRIRPGKKEKVLAQLADAGVPYKDAGGNCIAVAPGAKLDELLMLNRDAVVQDKSSQQVLSPIYPLLATNQSFTAWDCCAASGGKSILLKDAYPASKLTVSDIRESIIANLHKRFKAAGINDYRHFVGDVSAPSFSIGQSFDLVLCDAPCSGSGTWGRTPEQLHFFKEEKILHYASLQERIALNAAKHLRPDGVFLYITCSVFKEENEAVVAQIANSGLRLQGMQYFKGWEQKADTLFAAAFTRS